MTFIKWHLHSVCRWVDHPDELKGHLGLFLESSPYSEKGYSSMTLLHYLIRTSAHIAVWFTSI